MFVITPLSSLQESKFVVERVENIPNPDFCNITANYTDIEEGFLINGYGTIFQDMDKISVGTLNLNITRF